MRKNDGKIDDESFVSNADIKGMKNEIIEVRNSIAVLLV